MNDILAPDLMHLKTGDINLGVSRLQLAKYGADLQTSIMAVTFDGGVVLGADSRTTSGSYIVSQLYSPPFIITTLSLILFSIIMLIDLTDLCRPTE